jgi:SAM-dependent methyltransferase
MGWTDREGRPVEAPEPPPEGSYYGPIGDFQGAEYDRNAFALGTEQEVAFLVEALELVPGMRVIDVGCGTGRHTAALAGLGLEVVGVDLSHGLLRAALGRGAGHLLQADARAVPLPDGCADAVLCLCQGGFGITPGDDEQVLAELARLLTSGARLALTAFSLAFAVRSLAPEDALDLSRGLVHSPAEVRGPDGVRQVFDLWTACYSAAHLETLARRQGLRPDRLSGVEPGAYGFDPPRIDHPELLLVATKP